MERASRMSKLLLILILSLLMQSELIRSYEQEDEDQDFDNPQDEDGQSEVFGGSLGRAAQESQGSARRDLYTYEDRDDEADDEEDEADLPKPPTTPATPAPRNKTLLGKNTRKGKLNLARRTKKHSLECFSCSYKKGHSLRACLHPNKYQVSVIKCHSSDDRCYTSVQGDSLEHLNMVVRGCRSNCFSSPLWSCCESNKCNDVPYENLEAAPTRRVRGTPRVLVGGAVGGAHPPAPPPPAPLLFVGVLLLLQTVLKVILP